MLSLVKSLTSGQKRTIFLAVDAILVPLSLVFAFAVQSLPGSISANMQSYLPVLPYLLAALLGLSYWLGVCKVQLKYYETHAMGQTALLSAGLVGLSALFSWIGGLGFPFGLHVVFGITFFLFSVISRGVMLQMLLTVYRRSPRRCRVLIYGAGTTGMQLASALRSHETIEPVAFVDDNSAFWGVRLARLPVYAPVRIAEVVEEKKIDRVLVAIPSLNQPKQAQLVRRLSEMGIEVQMLPSFAQLIGEEALVDKLTPVKAHKFLNRAEVRETSIAEMNCYAKRVVMVSGAGGSIGSELCRQVLDCRPTKIVLYELSEFALYNIDMEMRQLIEDTGIEVVSVLGSITDARHVRKVMQDHAVQVVLHAAAYKHVPLVEANPLSGLVNNVIGTQTLAHQAAKAGVERFILISSDKAVRPTNVMGASKRLAEQVVQDLARRVPEGSGPVFTMVRFGNVLGSSGSVIPLFQDQLSRGGPITVTDPNVKRYFMTVQEAVKLVLQAGAMARGGEVFVLDMGKPVSILHLARQVIENAGYTVRDAANPDGDIEIKITGLRPGEKLFEELTLSGDLYGTRHPKIFSTREDSLSEIEIAAALRSLREAFVASDEDMAREVVMRWVEGMRAASDAKSDDAQRLGT
ncbi:nucleoside-diphosphate sugar epimerase/dehydratase [Sulfitobacter sp. D35]|uniref:polysaccharide biosynthesis protein n=1 Tax=Sulfitobacter sp. D35 TaxID=3083252 RepID=UPI00296F5565|nr:nucleoside-diphosphate sugar epimerase/dehydratase [Sulfitobacter sp. D35]MDW4498213.1 nucleoside-diphosphate sugar epimerase/dehydratase [Sulfitobacter sp. D35]